MTTKLLTLLVLASLAACGRSSLSNRGAPDELLAGRQAPLIVPPDYALTPPRPGAPRPLAPDARQEALGTLFPDTQPQRSPAEAALLQQSGADKRDPSARATASDPGTTVVDKGVVTKEVIESAPTPGDPAQATLKPGA